MCREGTCQNIHMEIRDSFGHQSSPCSVFAAGTLLLLHGMLWRAGHGFLGLSCLLHLSTGALTMGTCATCLAFDVHSEDSNTTYTLWLLFLPTMPSPQLLKRPLLILATSGAVMELHSRVY